MGWHRCRGNRMVVNKEVLKSKGIDTVPTSYKDLLDPKYAGLIVMPNPASSGTGLLTVNGILSLYGEEAGWEYLDALDKNVAVYMHSGSQPAKETAAENTVSAFPLVIVV